MKQFIILPKEEGGSVQWGNEFTWESLQDGGVSHLKSDVRFTLYDTSTHLNECIFFDVDKVPHEHKEKVVDILCTTVGDYDHYAVDSGGGVHVYYLLEKGLTKEDFSRRREGYLSLCAVIEERIREAGIPIKEVDRAKFCNKQLGRAPGSYNTKRECATKLISYSVGGTKFPLDENFPARSVTDVEEREEAIHEMVIPEEVLLECRAVRHFTKNPGQYESYDLWFGIGNIYKGIGRIKKFLSLSKESPHHDKPNEHVDNPKAPYTYSCGRIKLLCKESEIETNPCKGCPHYTASNIPLFISGKLPTPSRQSGFVTSHKKEKDGSVSKIVPKINIDDTVNHYINVNAQTLVRSQETGEFIKYSVRVWQVVADKTLSKGDLSFRKSLHELPIGVRATYTVRKAMDDCLRMHTGVRCVGEESFDTQSLLVFKNCAFKINLISKTLEKIPLSPALMNRSYIPHTLSKEADCPNFRAYMKWVTDGDTGMENILKIIMGLAISSISPTTYQKFFWLTGNSGTGKSIFVGLLSDLVGFSNVAQFAPSPLGGLHERPDLRGKLVMASNDLKPSSWTKGQLLRYLTFIQEITGDSAISQKVAHSAHTTVSPVCLPIATSNEPLEGVGSVTGIKRRYVPIEFYRVPKEVDDMFGRKLKQELTGIYNYAIEGLQLYLDGGMSTYNSEALVEEAAEEDANPYLRFLTQNYVRGEVYDRVATRELYHDFMAFQEEPAGDATHKRLVSRGLKRTLCEMYQMKTAGVGYQSNGVRYLRYLKRKVDERA